MSYFCLLYTTWYNEPISNKKSTFYRASFLPAELIIFKSFFVTLYVFSTYLNLIVFEKIKLDLEQAYACFSVPNHCKITKCFNFKKYLTESLQQWAFCFVLKG